MKQNDNSKIKVIVGMSGGVDSSVAALLLKDNGYTVEGLFMKNWEEDDTDTYCAASKDLEDVQAVCSKLNIKLNTVNFATEYWDNVFTNFLTEYKDGRTPNPDILCNKEIKFKAALDFVEHLGGDFFATGHYAKKILNGEYYLAKPCDKNKDQTYFLYTLSQKQLAKVLFPLEDLNKTQIREIAKNAGFLNHNKKDSTGICFIGERKFKTFLEQYLKPTPGKIITDAGDVLGNHDGLMYYTLGQRQGLKIGGVANSTNEPWYVVAKDQSANHLIVTQGENSPLLYKDGLTANNLSWVTASDNISSIGIDSNSTFVCSAKIRYRHQDEPCTVTFNDHNKDSVKVVFGKKQKAITPGQSIVFYNGDICLGGGIINTAF